MKITCGACGKIHKSNAKLEASLDKLQPGQKVRIKCSQCGASIPLSRTDLQSGGSVSLAPPGPPDTSWLKEGIFDEEEIVSDIPLALVLMKESEAREKITVALTGLGYKTETAEQTAEVIKKMQFVNYTCVILHTGSIDGDFEDNRLHRFMKSMEMSRRRYIFYVLLGPEFKTFYNLQALTHSANLVVNDGDAHYFGVILRKAIPEYELLFGPYMDELKIQGK
ncbi:MAG: hypothetical protein P8X39_07125 [Desulfofustis sp.]|jgi:hypothetical protein